MHPTALALLLAASCAGAAPAGAIVKGGTVAEPINPVAGLDSRQVESVSVQRFWFSGTSRETDAQGNVVIHTGGPGGGFRWGANCPLAGADVAAVIAALASAEPAAPDGEVMRRAMQVRIRSGDGPEIVAIVPPPEMAGPDGSFAIGIAGQPYRLDSDGLATIERIAAAAGCPQSPG